VIACKTRLNLLWLLFENEGLCVLDLAQRAGISEKTASSQLRALNARGLITPYRQGLKVFYHPEVNTEVEHAETLLNGLRDCCIHQMPFDTVMRQATAFTHARRIQLVQALKGTPSTFGDLQKKSGIPVPSLSHHLAKLEARGFIKRIYGTYRLNTPGNSFGRVLLQIVVKR
jgi:DNA-binding transcriptional ArsR family regulator